MTPLSPLIGVSSPPLFPPPFSSEIQPPLMAPSWHYGLNLPLRNPYPNPHHDSVAAPSMVGGSTMMAAPMANGGEGLWCKAKPSVPLRKLQEAMDYAFGAGGADCEAISPRGNYYFLDSIIAHASYAFNSYWQKKKKKN